MLGIRLAALLLIFFFGACTAGGDKDCILADNKTSNVSIDYGKALPLKPKLCAVKKAGDVTYEWSLNEELVGIAPEYRFLACPRFKGTKTKVHVALTHGGKKASHAWNITVRDVTPRYRDCGATLTVQDSIAALQKGDFYGAETGIDFKTAVSCLDDALRDYPCDIDLAFWAAYGDILLFAQHGPTSFFVSGLSERTLNELIDETIDPLLARFDLLATEMPSDFVADPQDFDFSPLGLSDLQIHPGGEWDRGDMYAIDGVFQLIKGGAKFAASYVGSVKLAQMVGLTGITRGATQGNIAEISPLLQNKLVTELDDDPNFLTLFPGDEGKERLAVSRTALILGFTRLNDAISFVKSETDDQKDDMFRYFDCGSDAVCPPAESRDKVRGDPGEALIKDQDHDGKFDADTDSYDDSNGNGRYDPSWRAAGPDAGEADGHYSEGETIGTDAFTGLLSRIGIAIPPLAQDFLTDVAANIKGPNALDLVKYTPLPDSQIVQYSVVSGLNIPMLRLSKWFEGPRDIRDFVPLWSHADRRFVVDREEEAWDDLGYDQKSDSMEAVTTATFPECATRATALKLVDPAGDDFLALSNPNDGCDNDWDGFIDETDGSGRSKDYGQEGNGIFDYHDDNLNGKHETGEESEGWPDAGIRSGTASPVGQGNGRWDAIDMGHFWPKGALVGGRAVEIEKDPRNGTLQDGLQPLIDPVYYFFPDAQFNGVIVFEKPTVNADNITLTFNAELMRFISKLAQTARSLIK